MNRKRREKPYNYNNSRHDPYSFPKRRRPLPSPPPPPFTDDGNPSSPTSVLVMGLPTDCSVLDLKSRFEVYGSISRTRINPDNDGVVVGSITFRSKSSAEAAISASVDPSFGITVDSKRVLLQGVYDGQVAVLISGVKLIPNLLRIIYIPKTLKHGTAQRILQPGNHHYHVKAPAKKAYSFKLRYKC